MRSVGAGRLPGLMNTLSHSRVHRLILGLAGLLLLFTVATACEKEPEVPPEIYQVRALVRHLPEPDEARPEILVRHEAIPSFKNADGEVVGMETMSMPFPLADTGLIADLEAGDRVELTFEVSWHGGNPLKVTAIEKLPEGTQLAFEAP